MAVSLARGLALLSLLVGAVIYIGAVAGLFFAAATPPADTGALSVLVIAGLFGGLAFLLDRTPAT